ncbi:MAG: hypothetical protein IT350_00015 [Deltaproteobacteria bacterium]|nr:hypothetical protein [Deltaproteobacteria bacterium]
MAMDEHPKPRIDWSLNPIDNVRQVARIHRNAAIGGGVGAALGAFVLGPWGAALGGAVGGYVGSRMDEKDRAAERTPPDAPIPPGTPGT